MELQGGVSAVVAMGGPDAPPGDGGVRAYLAGTERGVIFHVELSQGHGRAAPMLESHFEPVRPALTLTLTLTLNLNPNPNPNPYPNPNPHSHTPHTRPSHAAPPHTAVHPP